MKITSIRAYQVDLPLHEGSYKWSGGKSVAVFDSTVVAVETDAGITGYGEVCPLGPAYLPAYAAGVRAGLEEIGAAAARPGPARSRRAQPAHGRGAARPPLRQVRIDIACWDILGKATGQPVCTLLGGRYGEDFVLYRAISQESPQDMAKTRRRAIAPRATRKFQLKVGGDPDVDIERIRAVAREAGAGRSCSIADANTGWLMHEATRVVDAVRDVDVYIEQPCMTYEECLSIRRRTDAAVRARREHRLASTCCCAATSGSAMDVINLKISQGRRPDQGEADPRPVRRARHRHDHRGYLGRRHRDRGDRASRALDAA